MKALEIVLIVAMAAVVSASDDIVREEIVVYASKDETPLDRTHTNTIIVTAEEIAAHSWTSVAQILHRLPGISLVSGGGDGALTTVFARGAKSENLLVLLDGARLNDPSGVGRGFDFGNLSTHNIARVEIVLGPQNTLYGTDASSGVINIITRRSSEDLEGEIAAEFSDEDANRQSVRVSGANGDFSYALAGERLDTETISARGDNDTAEPDAHDNNTIHARFGYQPNVRDSLDVGFASINADLDIDNFDGDDPNYTNDYTQQLVSASYQTRIGDQWDLGFFGDFTDTERNSLDETDPARPDSSSEGRFEGQSLRVEGRARADLSERVDLLLGLVHEQEDAEGRSLSVSAFGPFESVYEGDTDTTALFAVAGYRQAGFDLDVGARYNDHSLFGDETTWQVGAGYRFEASDTRLRASYATGFRAPSVFQLYSSFGNLELLPETSDAIELGFSSGFDQGRGVFGASWYQNEYEDLIEFFTDPVTFNSFYFNIDSAETEGVEVYVSYTLDRYSLRVAYEDLEADNTSTPGVTLPLIRRVDNKASIRLQYRPTNELQIAGDVLFYGESQDTDFSTFPSENVILDSYTLVGLKLGYTVWEALDLSLRAENLTDEDYVQILGFNTIPRRVFLGAAWRF